MCSQQISHTEPARAVSWSALVPGFGYFAVWFLLAVFAFLFIGIETRGRTLDEQTPPSPAAAPDGRGRRSATAQPAARQISTPRLSPASRRRQRRASHAG
jgi:hypothetical protein